MDILHILSWLYTGFTWLVLACAVIFGLVFFSLGLATLISTLWRGVYGNNVANSHTINFPRKEGKLHMVNNVLHNFLDFYEILMIITFIGFIVATVIASIIYFL